MSESKPPPPEHDLSAELGLRNPVRDQERSGPQKFSVTPPRSQLRAPHDGSSEKVSCHTCRNELDPTDSYRVDAEEYIYYFCGDECYAHWHTGEDRKQAGTQ
jgi:hypothetical protein